MQNSMKSVNNVRCGVATKAITKSQQSIIRFNSKPSQPIRSPFRFRVRAFSDDEDMVPIVTGRRKKGFTPKEYEMLKNPKLLGGKTMGEELQMIRNNYVKAQEEAQNKADTQFKTSNWDGDVYIGSRWNTLSVLYLIFMAVPALLGVFAWLSYGHLWGITPGLYN